MEEVAKVLLLQELELVGSALEDQEDVAYESLPEEDCADKGFPDSFLVAVCEEVGIWRGRFSSHGDAGHLDKMSTQELKVAVLQDGFK